MMNPSKILCWNVRGLNSRARQDAVRTLVDSCRVDIVCLQETKMTVMPPGVILSMLGSDFTQWVDLPAAGASGGVIIAWCQGLGPASASRVDDHSVSVQFSPSCLQSWWLTCVYGPQGDERNILFLQELRTVRSVCHGPWAVLGDFNLITSAEDKSNGILNRAMMGRFRRLINDLELKSCHCKAENILGPTSRTPLHLSGWIECSAPLIGKIFSQIACCKVAPQMAPTTAPS